METFRRIIKLGYTNFWRNRWLTLGATLLMTLTLTMISVSLLISLIIRDTATDVRSKIGLTIYFKDDTVPDAAITGLGKRIEKLSDVKAVDYVDKKKALEIFGRLPLNEDIKKPVGDTFNPLPRSLEVKITNLDQIGALQTDIGKADSSRIICSECVSLAQNKDVVDSLIRGTKAMQQAGWFLSIFFGVIAIFNVFNIIRLTIASRSDEIEIMRFVGASNSFIRGPFIVEGILYGLLGTILTSTFLPVSVRLLVLTDAGKGISTAFSFLGTDIYSYLLNNFVLLVAVQLVIGLGLGVIVSAISIRKYLRA